VASNQTEDAKPGTDVWDWLSNRLGFGDVIESSESGNTFPAFRSQKLLNAVDYNK